MGCSGSKTGVEDQPKSETDAPTTSDTKFPLSEAFVIPLDNPEHDADNSIITATAKLGTPNKLPPKRLQKLMEQAATTEATLNLEQLEDKLNKAELRRKEYLQQKLDNIQKNTSTSSSNASTQLARNTEDTREQELISSPDCKNEEAEEEEGGEHSGHCADVDNKMKYASEINAKALDDDSKQELLLSTNNK